jgi:hypothetical protein
MNYTMHYTTVVSLVRLTVCVTSFRREGNGAAAGSMGVGMFMHRSERLTGTRHAPCRARRAHVGPAGGRGEWHSV